MNRGDRRERSRIGCTSGSINCIYHLLSKKSGWRLWTSRVVRTNLAIILITILLGCGCTNTNRERLQISKSHAQINLEDFQIYVGREVWLPGAYALTNGMRLTDAIQSAGGLTDFAIRSRVRVIHSDRTKEVHDYDRILKKQAEDPLLRPGDHVIVTAPIF